MICDCNRISTIAIKRNVEELNITLCDFDPEEEYELRDEVFFISSCLTDLTLQGCNLNPSGAISWINLRSLSISRGNLDEKLIEKILSGSPVLETLVLDDCYGFKWLNITSKSVKRLVYSGYITLESPFGGALIKINAPNISSLTVNTDLELCKVFLVHTSCLVEAKLYPTSTINGVWDITDEEEEEEDLLKRLVLNLRHAKELKIGGPCAKAVFRLKAKGFDFPSNFKFPE